MWDGLSCEVTVRTNSLRNLLRDGKPSLGTHLHSSWPGIVELVGHSGMFDYIEFEGEYAPYDLYSLENIGRAINLFEGMSGMMKVDQQPRAFLAQRAIGSGIQNILFADARTTEDAEECVRAVRPETPEGRGRHGAGMRRDVGYALEIGSKAYVQALEDAVVVLMIEKRQIVEALDEVLSVSGIDMVQFGPADYSMSIGIPGQFQHPEVLEAERYVIGEAIRRGIAPRAEVNRPGDAQRFLDMGVRHFCMGSDVVILLDWFRTAGMEMRRLLDLS